MAPDRMADRRTRTDQILLRYLASLLRAQSAGRVGQAALAHRTRLPGSQAGTWARSLRGTRMARIPSPRSTLHRRLRIPGLRAESDSPLRTGLAPEGAARTHRIPPARRAR